MVTFGDEWSRRRGEILLPLVCTVFAGALFAFFMLYPRRKMPPYERATELARIADLSDTGWAAMNVLYGRDPFERPDPTNPNARPLV